MGIAALGFIGWCPKPERARAELRLTRQSLPSHEPLTAACSDWSGSQAFAVGKHGAVIARRSGSSGGNDALEAWVHVPGAHSDLVAVAYGDGPAAFRDSTPRVFAVGLRGTLVDCRMTECRAISLGTDRNLHDIVIAGGQAIAVGDDGTILHVTVDADQARRQTLADLDSSQQPGIRTRDESELVRVEGVDAGVTTSLRSVALTCDEYMRCRAKIVGEANIVIEGEGSGPCDNGRAYASLGYRHCRWTWTTRNALPDEARPERPSTLAVHVITKRGLWRTETSKRDALVFSTTARVGSTTLALASPIEVRAVAPFPGDGFVVGVDGELYAVE